MALLERLQSRLSGRGRRVIDAGDALACAVLVPIVDAADGLEVLYTLRSEELTDHKGQVSFPGGKRQAEDADLEATALREAYEEIGVAGRDLDVLGLLDDVTTMQGMYIITPVVARMRAGVSLSTNPAEVSDTFTVSVEKLNDPRYREIDHKSFQGDTYEIDTITAGPHVIWGVTHHITLDLLSHLRSADLHSTHPRWLR